MKDYSESILDAANTLTDSPDEYNGFIDGAAWYKNQILALIDKEILESDYNDAIDSLNELYEKVLKL